MPPTTDRKFGRAIASNRLGAGGELSREPSARPPAILEVMAKFGRKRQRRFGSCDATRSVLRTWSQKTEVANVWREVLTVLKAM